MPNIFTSLLAAPEVITKTVATVTGAVDAVVKKYFPDPVEQERVRSEIALAVRDADYKDAALAATVITAEAQSGGFLASNWRPITMLVFVALITARWLGYAASGMTEAEYLEVYSLIKLGLGGYVVGRSVEKIAPGIVDAVKSLAGK